VPGTPPSARWIGSAVSASSPPTTRGAMNARWRAAISGSSRAEECTNESM
jgi:hypothetical protein